MVAMAFVAAVYAVLVADRREPSGDSGIGRAGSGVEE
jgi:hypothetical protein